MFANFATNGYAYGVSRAAARLAGRSRPRPYVGLSAALFLFSAYMLLSHLQKDLSDIGGRTADRENPLGLFAETLCSFPFLLFTGTVVLNLLHLV